MLAKLIPIAQDPFEHTATAAINFSHITELLRTVADNLSGFEPTVKE